MDENLAATLEATDLRDILGIKEGVGEDWISPFQKAFQDYLDKKTKERLGKELSPTTKELVEAMDLRDRAIKNKEKREFLSRLAEIYLQTTGIVPKNAGETQVIPKSPSSPRSLAAERNQAERDAMRKKQIAETYRNAGYDVAEDEIVLDNTGDSFTLKDKPGEFIKKLRLTPFSRNIVSTFKERK